MMRWNPTQNKAFCPSCETLIKFGSRAKMGEMVVCRTCRAMLKVVGLDPVEMDWIHDDDNRPSRNGKHPRRETDVRKRSKKQLPREVDSENDDWVSGKYAVWMRR